MNDNPKYIECLSEITQINIELEGMKALNQYREQRGETQAYGEQAFYDLQAKLYNRTIELLYRS